MNSICANPAPRLWLVRHARPLVAPGICYGRLDMQADAQSTADAAQALHLALPADCLLAHSPLRRCRQLAQALQALRPGLASAMDSRLLEMDFGEWEGQPWDALDRSAIDAWAADLAGHAPGRGESLATMLRRVDEALQQASRGSVGDGAARDTVWITHAGVARCVQWLMREGSALPQAGQWTLPAPDFGGWLVLDLPLPR
ncbi:Phosphoglycerate mutase [Delftia acidovorans SPH-1]|uniref:Phosphoglycerate mutase n=1 Tax=Delftia acidovorans (strain DSM 14801 / SPH-1) TaxID=398578 RepID=A9BXN9_DELAS|nr:MULTISPECIES: histidine phosphatase family protein [Delftia]MBA4005041.1 phosphoglycerate kinase [Delftia sp.]OLE93556.1 MAG: phosphoglycerate kinase [Delftia sp. 13_1_40CM_3_66_6]ABX38315.1 Phosphoglycerate mutase [Delftia acidovorans SPH-1]MBN9322635.1 histidine phosphatase family protein [Delftia acidovorans]MCP4017888.1 phosphoglycerate kinase [Delftia sp.]